MSDRKPGFVLWFTGLPASGKTTLARELEPMLAERGIPVQVLDSDEIRSWLTPDPQYTEQERDWYYRALVQIAKLLSDNGVDVLIAATGAKREYREAARQAIDQFAEVYVQCSEEVCRVRDPKGLWSGSDRGEIDTLPGADILYQVPLDPEIRINTGERSVQQSVKDFFDQASKLPLWPSATLEG